MMARTHDLAALTMFGLVVVARPLQDVTMATILVALLANQIGGIVPDIDQPTAPFWRNLPIGGVFGKITGKMLGGHRFITHSLLGVGLFGVLARVLLTFLHPIMPRVDINIVWWAFIIGILSHLIMDSLTKEGVPWLLPVPIKFGVPPIKSFRVTTGKVGEKMIFLSLVTFNIWFYSVNYQHLLIIIHQYII